MGRAIRRKECNYFIPYVLSNESAPSTKLMKFTVGAHLVLHEDTKGLTIDVQLPCTCTEFFSEMSGRVTKQRFPPPVGKIIDLAYCDTASACSSVGLSYPFH